MKIIQVFCSFPRFLVYLLCLALVWNCYKYVEYIYKDSFYGLQQHQQFCVGSHAKSCIRPLINFKQRYRISKKYKLLGCAIDKNFSTMLTAILCFLHNEQKFLKSGRKLVEEEFHRRFCGPQNEFSWLHDVAETFNITSELAWKKWSLLAIVRDPLERFVSGFTDKCIIEKSWKSYPDRCNRCKTNLTCFMERQYQRMLRKSNKQKIFANFDDDHFHPQNWRCEFYCNLHRYEILQYNSEYPSMFLNELYTVLHRHNVSENSIRFIQTSISSNRTQHSTVYRPERKMITNAIVGNPYHMKLLIKMYYYDYILFNFPLPSIEL